MIIYGNIPWSRSISREKGFSLIEVLVSLTILAMSMMALMSMQTAALRSSSNNQNILGAQQVAEWATEWVRTLSDDALTASPVSVFPDHGADSSGGLGLDDEFDLLVAKVSSDAVIPSSFSALTFKRFVGYRLSSVQDPDIQHADRLYVVRVMVIKKYKWELVASVQESVMSECLVTVYWVQDGALQSLDIPFFVDRKT